MSTPKTARQVPWWLQVVVGVAIISGILVVALRKQPRE